jgi:hypothetical protein
MNIDIISLVKQVKESKTKMLVFNKEIASSRNQLTEPQIKQ